MTEKVLEEGRKEIAAFFKAKREKLGLSQEQVAELTGISRKSVNAFENARFWPTLKLYILLCEALKINWKLWKEKS